MPNFRARMQMCESGGDAALRYQMSDNQRNKYQI